MLATNLIIVHLQPKIAQHRLKIALAVGDWLKIAPAVGVTYQPTCSTSASKYEPANIKLFMLIMHG